MQATVSKVPARNAEHITESSRETCTEVVISPSSSLDYKWCRGTVRRDGCPGLTVDTVATAATVACEVGEVRTQAALLGPLL
jgi:hypothetical protein